MRRIHVDLTNQPETEWRRSTTSEFTFPVARISSLSILYATVPNLTPILHTLGTELNRGKLRLVLRWRPWPRSARRHDIAHQRGAALLFCLRESDENSHHTNRDQQNHVNDEGR